MVARGTRGLGELGIARDTRAGRLHFEGLHGASLFDGPTRRDRPKAAARPGQLQRLDSCGFLIPGPPACFLGSLTRGDARLAARSTDFVGCCLMNHQLQPDFASLGYGIRLSKPSKTCAK